MRYLVALLSLVSTSVFAQVDVTDAWSRATPPGAKVAAGYLVMQNKAATADKLIGASSPMAARVETHVTEKQGEVLRMREVKGYDVPAKGSFELKPSGPHLMLVDIKRPFKAGEKIPLVLRFQNAGEIKTELEVRALGATGAHNH
jgi:periplasmic copper chaperone A